MSKPRMKRLFKQIGENNKIRTAFRITMQKGVDGRPLAPRSKNRVGGQTKPPGGSLPAKIQRGHVAPRFDGWTESYPARAGGKPLEYYDRGAGGRQVARRIIGVTRDQQIEIVKKVVNELRLIGKAKGLFK